MEKQKAFGVKEAQNLLSSVTAPWIQDLDLQIISISELKCKFTLNYSEKLVRAGNIICGQAIVSAADTAMIVAVISAIGKYQEITTVDISCKYLRPLLRGGGLIETEILVVISIPLYTSPKEPLPIFLNILNLLLKDNILNCI